MSNLVTVDGIKHSMSFGELKTLFELGYDFYYEYVLDCDVITGSNLYLGNHEVTNCDELSKEFVDAMIEEYLFTDEKITVAVDGIFETVTIYG